MEFRNQTSHAANVAVFDSGDQIRTVPRWSAIVGSGGSSVYKPSSGDDHTYQAKVTISFGFLNEKVEWVYGLRDSGQDVAISPSGGSSFSLRVNHPPAAAPPPPSAGVDGSNWMGNLGDAIADRDLRKMLLLGSHDSGSFSADLTALARTQNLDFGGQLAVGVRFFDLRITWSGDHPGAPFEANTFYLCHDSVSAVDMQLRPQLEAIDAFAKRHPKEIITLNIHDVMSGMSPFKGAMGKDTKDELVDQVQDSFASTLAPPEVFTVKDLWAMGRNVLVNWYEQPSKERGTTPALNSQQVASLYQSPGTAGFVASFVGSWPWSGVVDIPALKTYLDGVLPTVRKNHPTDFVMTSAVVWSSDIQMGSLVLNLQLERWIRDWWARSDTRAGLNVVLIDFVDHYDFLPCFTELLASRAAPSVHPSPSAQLARASTQTPDDNADPNGRNVAGVLFLVSNDEQASAFLQHGRTWLEVGPDGGTRYEFSETNRDEWSVYLHDESRRVDIQLDLYRKQVRYRPDGGTWLDLYAIVGARIR